MIAARDVRPEWLDELPATDPRAVRARADLGRVNRLLGSLSIVVRALDDLPRPRRLVELGAGDGTLALRLARRRARRWPGVALTLVDRQPIVAGTTLATLRAHGWPTEVVAADAVDWLAEQSGAARAVLLANLFVHHFDGERLVRLLERAAACADAFVCCEPRRSRIALAGSRLLGAIGANDVTRHDAIASVRAGFTDAELSATWSRAVARSARGGAWRLTERGAGLFSHLFVARRAA